MLEIIDTQCATAALQAVGLSERLAPLLVGRDGPTNHAKLRTRLQLCVVCGVGVEVSWREFLAGGAWEQVEDYWLAGVHDASEICALGGAGVSAPALRSYQIALGPGFDTTTVLALARFGFTPAMIARSRHLQRERFEPDPPAPCPGPLWAEGPDRVPVALELADGWDLRIAAEEADRAEALAALGGEVAAVDACAAWRHILAAGVGDADLALIPEALRDETLIVQARNRALARVLYRSGEPAPT